MQGFRVTIHDVNTIPSRSMAPVLVGPGFRTLIAVREKEIDRSKTESIGSCRSGVKLNFFPGLPYNKVTRLLSPDTRARLYSFIPGQLHR